MADDDKPTDDGDTLAAALARHGFALPPAQIDRLDQYCKLLWDWNEKINLTRHTDYEKFVSRDLDDNQQLAALIHSNEEVLEIGSGGGVPGLLLALLRPDLTVTLTESIGKKAKVLADIVQK